METSYKRNLIVYLTVFKIFANDTIKHINIFKSSNNINDQIFQVLLYLSVYFWCSLLLWPIRKSYI